MPPPSPRKVSSRPAAGAPRPRASAAAAGACACASDARPASSNLTPDPSDARPYNSDLGMGPSEAMVRATVDAMVQGGFVAAGYKYLNACTSDQTRHCPPPPTADPSLKCDPLAPLP